MFCTNCGNKLKGNEEFCPNCGENIKLVKEKVESSNKKRNNFKDFFKKYKKQMIIILSIVFAIIIGVILYGKIFGFEKLNWDESYNQINNKYITQSNLKLGIIFSDKNKLNELKYSTNCGDVKNNEYEITWNLTESIGKCEISVSYKLKKITKEFTVISFNLKENDLALNGEETYDESEDADGDKLTNSQEKEYNTNPELADSDMDGLDDHYEIFVSKTNPNNKDTDGDGLSDYDEIKLELDPNKADSKNDGIKDGKRELTYTYESDNIKLIIVGNGNIASTVSEVNENTKISGKAGLIDKLYSLYTDGTMKEATLIIKYTNEEIKKYGLNEDNLSIYYYNTDTSKYEKIDSEVDKKNKTVTAKLKHFSNYVVGDSSLVKESTTIQVLFILDNSWSMYSEEQYTKYTGKKFNSSLYSSLDASDEDGIRFTLTADLASKLSAKNYQIGLSEFRGDYKNALPIGSNIKDIKKKLNNMTGKFITLSEGTNIGGALSSGIRDFSKNSDNKYIIILTDGEDPVLRFRTDDIIKKAINNSVKICSVGFGEGSQNADLEKISNATGCKFYSSANALGLNELFNNINVELDDNLVDIDDDGKYDGILIADSGFIVNRDGFSFENYVSNLSSGGHCYGMATFAELYYKKVLPLKADSKNVKKTMVRGYDLSNTYFKKYGNLYDYKLGSNILKYSFGFDLFGEEQPSDFLELNGKTLSYNSKYKKAIIDSKIYDIKESKSSLSKERQLEKYGLNYESAENIYMNEDKMQTSKLITNDDMQMFNAIWYSFIKQDVTSYYTSSGNFLLTLRNLVGTEETSYKGSKGFINVLKSRLKDKDAPVIFSSFNGGLHGINAISLIQDIDNPNLYYIAVYDNNYPGEKRYVDMVCNQKKCVTKTNKYYSKSNEPIRISPSLKYDLSFYTN
mgnify:FL=1